MASYKLAAAEAIAAKEKAEALTEECVTKGNLLGKEYLKTLGEFEALAKTTEALRGELAYTKAQLANVRDLANARDGQYQGALAALKVVVQEG